MDNQICLSSEVNLKIMDLHASLLPCMSDLQLVMSRVDTNDLYSRLDTVRQFILDVEFIISFITPKND